MRFGVSSACFYPMDLIESLESLAKNDVKELEIFVNTESELTLSFSNKIKKITNAYGITVTSVHPFTSGYEYMMIFSDYKKRLNDAIEFYKRYYSFANELGAKLVVLHGDKRFADTGGIPDEEYFERYYKLAQAGRATGVTLAQENVNLFRSQSPEFIAKMKEYLHNDVEFVLDIKQAVRAGFSPYDMCSAMGNRIVHLHINDNNATTDCMLPGEGTMDYKRLLTQVKKQGFNGTAVIEVYRKNFTTLDELINSHKYMNSNFYDI